MKVVILAGGLGTRLSEETTIKPKPMVEIGNEPIIWHIMKIYYQYGFNEFIICTGYKQEIIKNFFTSYVFSHGDIQLDLSSNQIEVIKPPKEKWKIEIVDTGLDTMTGGRLKRVQHLIGNNTFMLTYGDGLADINIKHLLEFHKNHGKLATITASRPVGRFGALSLDTNEHVSEFVEKPPGDGTWINGGFFVLEPGVFDLLKNDKTVWENEPLTELTARKELVAYKHYGFWRPMDTMSDKRYLENLWSKGKAPWKTW